MNDLWRTLLHARADTTLAIGLVLALATTVHILLRKREVASAVGWIGLVWFAPILGAISYLMFGVNRVRRRARQLRPPDSDPAGRSPWPAPDAEADLDALKRGNGRIADRPLLPGTTVQAYQNGDQAYPPMLQAIAAARRSVGLSSYMFQDDQWGRPLHRRLGRGRGARRRGPRADRRHRRRLAALPRLPSPARPRRRRRPLHAFLAALAHAVHQPALAQEDPAARRHHRLHRRHEHRRRERHRQPLRPPGAGPAFPHRRPGRRTARRGVRRGLELRHRRRPGE